MSLGRLRLWWRYRRWVWLGRHWMRRKDGRWDSRCRVMFIRFGLVLHGRVL